ncbi:MAG TPA: hypothetical protein VIT89_03195 [Solirubrobacterales bacterium]
MAAGLAIGAVSRVVGLSGENLYLYWALTICLVLAVVAPWALRGTGRRIPVVQTSEPTFRLVRHWQGNQVLIPFEEECKVLGREDFDFLGDGDTFEPYVHLVPLEGESVLEEDPDPPVDNHETCVQVK